MEKQHYVSLETAKLLKAHGYIGHSWSRYVEKVQGTERKKWDDEDGRYVTTTDVVTYPKPTLYEAQEYLRDKYNINICVIGNYRCDGSLCGFELWIQGLPQGREALYYETDSLSEYDMALETAINKALHLIEKE